MYQSEVVQLCIRAVLVSNRHAVFDSADAEIAAKAMKAAAKVRAIGFKNQSRAASFRCWLAGPPRIALRPRPEADPVCRARCSRGPKQLLGSKPH